MRTPKPSHRILSAFVSAALALLTLPAWAEEKPRTDPSGDPLPEGATARLGSLRWRHSGAVNFVAYASGGKEIISSAGDGVFHVWEAETGKEVRHFGEALKNPNPNPGFMIGWQDPSRTFQICLPDDGKTLAVAAPDQKIHIWDITTGKELRSFGHGHQQFAAGLAFAPDGKALVSRGPDQKIKVWDPAEGKLIREFNEQGGGGNVFWGNGSSPLVVSPDGKYIAGASATFDRGVSFSLRVWDLKEGKEVQKMKDAAVRGGMITNVWPTFSPDSKNVAWPRFDGAIQIYEAATGKEVQKLGDETADRRVLRMQYAPDGKSLAVLTSDQTITLFDTGTGKKLKEIGEEPPGIFGKAMPKAIRTNPMNFSISTALAFAPDGKSVLQGWGNLVRQWNVETGKGNDVAVGHACEVAAVLLSEDGKSVLTAGGDSTIRTWDLASGKESKKIELPPETVTTLFSSSKRAVVRDDTSVRVWDLAAGKEVLKIDAGGGAVANPFTGMTGQISLSSDGKTLACSSSDQVIRAFNIETSKEINASKELQFADPQGRKFLYALGCSPDGASIAVQIYTIDIVLVPGGGARQELKFLVRLYDVESGKALWEMNGATGQCRAITFSPDGRNLAFINGDAASVFVLEASTGKERGRFNVPAASLAFSADSRFLAIGTNEGAVKVMDVRGNKEVAGFQGHLGRVRSMSFSPDAASLFSGGAEGTTLVWNIRDAVQKARQPAEVDPETVKRLWGELADADGAKAFRALVALGNSPKTSVPWLKEQLKPTKGEDTARIEKLIADLDNDDFDIRQKAFDELVKLGGQAKASLQKALEGEVPLEVRKRVDQLLERLAPGQIAPTADSVREIRALEVLETLGTAEARAVLESLAKGAAGTKMTIEAAAALKRLAAQK